MMMGIKKDRGRTIGNKMNNVNSTIGVKMTPISNNQFKQISNQLDIIENHKSNSKEVMRQPLGLKNKSNSKNKSGLEK